MYSVSNFRSLVFFVISIPLLVLGNIPADSVFNCGSSVNSIACDESTVAYEQSGSIKFVDISADTPAAQTAGSGIAPSIDVPNIVWETEITGYDQILVYDIEQSQSFQLTSGNFDHKAPSVSSEKTVYRFKDLSDSLWHIGATEIGQLSAGETTDICTASGGQYGPYIDGENVVWYDKRDSASGRNIYLYSITNSSETPICTDNSDQTYPVISGDTIVWLDYTNGLDNIDIYGYSISTGVKFALATGESNQDSPRISGNIIIWIDHASGSEGVYAFDTSSYSRFKVASGNGLIAAVSDEVICWYDGQNINATTLPLQTPLEIVSPTSGQNIISASQKTIEWTNSESSRDVDIMYSTDAGENWSVIASSVNGQVSSNWTVPEMVSSECLVAVCYSDEPDNIYASGIFTIAACDSALTADLSGDCFVDIEDLGMLASQWMQSGM